MSIQSVPLVKFATQTGLISMACRCLPLALAVGNSPGHFQQQADLRRPRIAFCVFFGWKFQLLLLETLPPPPPPPPPLHPSTPPPLHPSTPPPLPPPPSAACLRPKQLRTSQPRLRPKTGLPRRARALPGPARLKSLTSLPFGEEYCFFPCWI